MGTLNNGYPSRARVLDAELIEWLDRNADGLDTRADAADTLLSRLASANLLRVGVPIAQDGDGGNTVDAILAIAAVAEHSLTAAFVFWAQRTFIEYLLQSPNVGLSERWMPALLSGTHAGATGLSNAMKFLSGIESLQVQATPAAREGTDRWHLDGKLAWVTNLRATGFIVAAAVAHDSGNNASIFAIPHDAQGVTRSADLDLMALRGSNTAALGFSRVALDAQWQIHPDAQSFLPRVRPAFLGMQCGLSIGLIRRSIAQARRLGDATRDILGHEITALADACEQACKRLADGVASGVFETRPAPLFEIRIELADLVSRAVYLELQASGGRSYVRSAGLGFERRLREAAFVPIVTPSLVQLKGQLRVHAQSAIA